MAKTNGKAARGNREPKRRERYYIKLKPSGLEGPGQAGASRLVEVDRDVYLAFYQMARALRTLEEKDRRHRVISIEALPGADAADRRRMPHAWGLGDGPDTSRKHAEIEALYSAIEALGGEERAVVEAYLARADEIIHSRSPRRIVSVRAIAPIAGVERHRAGKALASAMEKLAADVTRAMDEFDAALEDDPASAFEDSARIW